MKAILNAIDHRILEVFDITLEAKEVQVNKFGNVCIKTNAEISFEKSDLELTWHALDRNLGWRLLDASLKLSISIYIVKVKHTG